ncbi:unnamed protein product [Amoebophrya sp. A120]|nr:unnamed protein product [Amoebophrya sp. A120]|eukprot:GSA120T00008864001.1
MIWTKNNYLQLLHNFAPLMNVPRFFFSLSLASVRPRVLVALSASEQLGAQHQFGVVYFYYPGLQAGRREGLKCKGCKRQHPNFSYVLSDKNSNFFEAMTRSQCQAKEKIYLQNVISDITRRN